MGSTRVSKLLYGNSLLSRSRRKSEVRIHVAHLAKNDFFCSFFDKELSNGCRLTKLAGRWLIIAFQSHTSLLFATRHPSPIRHNIVMCNPMDDMKALSNSSQAATEQDIMSILSIDRLDIKDSVKESYETEHVVSSELSSPSDSEEVFRERSMSIVEEMLLVLKRANPITDYRDDPDVAPVSKRSRRTLAFKMENEERDGVEDPVLAQEESTRDQKGGEQHQGEDDHTIETRHSL